MKLNDARISLENTRYTSAALNPLGMMLFEFKKASKVFDYGSCRLRTDQYPNIVILQGKTNVIEISIDDTYIFDQISVFLKTKIPYECREEINSGKNAPLTKRRSLEDSLSENCNIKPPNRPISVRKELEGGSKFDFNDSIIPEEERFRFTEKCGLYEERGGFGPSKLCADELDVSPYANKEELLKYHSDNKLLNKERYEPSTLCLSAPPKSLFGSSHAQTNQFTTTDDLKNLRTPVKRESVFKRLGSFLFRSGQRGSIFSSESKKTMNSGLKTVSQSKGKSKALKKVNKALSTTYRMIRLSQKLKCEAAIKLKCIDTSYLQDNRLSKALDQYISMGLTTPSTSEGEADDISKSGSLNINDDNQNKDVVMDLELQHQMDLGGNDYSYILKENKFSFRSLDKKVNEHVKRRILGIAVSIADVGPPELSDDPAEQIQRLAGYEKTVSMKFRHYKTFIEARRTGLFDTEMRISMIRSDLQFFIELARKFVIHVESTLFNKTEILIDAVFYCKLSTLAQILVTFKSSYLQFIKQQVGAYNKFSVSDMRKMYHSVFSFVNDYWVFEDHNRVVERTFVYLFGLFEELVKEIQGIHETVSLYVIS